MANITEGTTAPKKRKKKRMRLPNGIGSVHKINDGKNRRKPWRARVQAGVDYDETTGKAKYKYITLGYYEKEEDAIAALFEYRKDPYTLEASTCTFAELFEQWKEKKYEKISESGKRGYNSAFKNSEALHDMKVRDIRTEHLEQVMQSVEGGYQLQTRLKTFWGQVFKFALQHDIIQKNYADFVKTRDSDSGTKRTAISPEDREKIWKEADAGNRDAEIAIVYIYTGMRPSELLEVKKCNVDLNARIMVGGKKTEAGANRRIPLHHCIMPIMEKLMSEPGENLIMRTDTNKIQPMPYDRFKKYHWDALMEKLGMQQYTMHYTRHTCATIMREAKIEEDIRKLILGHKSMDITDRYTHHPDSMLLEAMDTVPSR